MVIKWVRQAEVLADRALALRDAYLAGQIRVSVPSLMAYELANVLRCKHDLTAIQVQQAVRSVFDMQFEWVPPSRAVLERAVEIGRVHDTTVYGAVFAAVAEAMGAACFTADERLCEHLAALPHVRFLGDVEGV